jgi:hypothetical protein
MDVKAALKARLATALAGQLATTVDNKPAVHWLKRPQAERLPSVTLQTISGDWPQTYDGLQATRSPRIQFDAWAESYAEAEAIRTAAVAALAPKATSNGIVFDNIQFEGERDFLERQGTTDIFSASMDLIVWHHPA